jgi:hypothetical protein
MDLSRDRIILELEARRNKKNGTTQIEMAESCRELFGVILK